jgi:alpha-L-fucosidase
MITTFTMPTTTLRSTSPRLTTTLLAAFAALGALALAPALRAQDGVTVDTSAPAITAAESPAARDARLAWWREAKFGLFIHWGTYSAYAGSYGGKHTYGEWIMHTAKIPVAEYRAHAEKFNPVSYDPVAWVRAAKAAGMRYIVITAKHHEGFALYPSDVTDWDIADATPYKKDLLAPLVAAARAEGIKIGFYYSQAQDWVHVGGAKSRYTEGDGWDAAHKGDFDRYLREIAVPQTRELLTRYQPDIFWWDTPTYMTKERAAPLADLLKLRPGILTNNRLGGGYNGDTHTPEQFVPVTGYPGDWETCMTIGWNWGYNARDTKLKSSTDLVRKLIDITAKGGNFLLNVSPTAEGLIPQGQLDRLAEVGAWLSKHSDAIYGTNAGPFNALSWGRATRRGERLYLHVTDWPADGKLRVPLLSRATSAHLLQNPGAKLALNAEPTRLVIDVPAAAPDPVATVIVLDLAAPPVVPPLVSRAATVTATAEDPAAPAAFANDGTGAKRWRAPADVKTASIVFALPAPAAVTGFGADEPDVWPRMKQSYVLAAEIDGTWRELAAGKTDGHGVTGRFAPVTATRFRMTMTCEKGAPGLAEFQLYQPE